MGLGRAERGRAQPSLRPPPAPAPDEGSGMEPSRTPLAAGGRQGRLQPPPPPKPPPRIKSALRPQPARPRRAATSGGGWSGGRLRVEGRGGPTGMEEAGRGERNPVPAAPVAGGAPPPAPPAPLSLRPPPPPVSRWLRWVGGGDGGSTPPPGPSRGGCGGGSGGWGGGGPGGPCCAAARLGSGGVGSGGWKLLRCPPENLRRRRLPGGFYRAGSRRRGFRSRRRPDAGLRTPPPQPSRYLRPLPSISPSFHPSPARSSIPASLPPSPHHAHPSVPSTPPTSAPRLPAHLPACSEALWRGGGSVSASCQPRAPQLRFAPEGKCSPEPPADLKPALGRGSSRSHPSLARSPSGQERATPGAGRWLRGEQGSAGRPGPPPLPRPPLPDHPRFAFCGKRLPSPELCPRVSRGTDHPLPPKPLPGGALPLPWGPVKLSSISWRWGGEERNEPVAKAKTPRDQELPALFTPAVAAGDAGGGFGVMGRVRV